MSVCRTCHATIGWVSLDSGKPIPINPVPDPTGNVAAIRSGRRLTGYVISAEKPFRPGHQLYRPHHADCHSEQPRVTRSAVPPALF